MIQRKTYFLALVAILLMVSPIQAQTRSIYIGDPIELEIEAADLSLDQVEDAFADFEVVDAKKDGDTVSLTIRTFTPGTYTVDVENQPLTIVVNSTLDDIQRDDIFQAEETTPQKSWHIPWFIGLGISLAALALSGLYLIYHHFKKEKVYKLSPYELFKRQAFDQELDNKLWLSQLTQGFKAYIESVYGIKSLDRSTQETMYLFWENEELRNHSDTIYEWFKACDYYKYSHSQLPDEQKSRIRDQIMAVVDTINTHSQEMNTTNIENQDVTV